LIRFFLYDAATLNPTIAHEGDPMPIRRLLLVVSLLVLARPALAADDPEGLLSDIEIHAFVSQGFIKTTENNYLVPRSKRGSFDLTEVGINFTKAITDRLRLGVQFFGGGLVTTGAYNAKTDWFYLDYRWRDWLGVRAGRVKLPFGLYNEVNDVDSARLPILLPQSTYPVANRNFLLAQTGFELYGYHGFDALGALEYRLYGGTILFDLTSPPNPLFSIKDADFAYLAGGRLMWETPIEGLRAGGSLQALRLDAQLQGVMNPKELETAEIPVILWMTSIEYSAHDWLLAAEYGRWHSETKTSNPAWVPATKPQTNERYYAMAGYRVAPWLQVGTYYAGYYVHYTIRDGAQNQQHDVAGTLRFDITPNWLIKLEAHYMHDTAALGAGTFPPNWAVFLLRTTAYF
jgi:hypothetical protein